MGSRLVFVDGEWITSDLELDQVAERMEAGRLVPAQRMGKLVLVNPVHIVSAEDWPATLPSDAG